MEQQPPAAPPAEPTEEYVPVRIRLPTGEAVQRRISLDASLALSVAEFVHFRQQSRTPLRVGLRDGHRIRWLELQDTPPAQGVLPMDLLWCETTS